MSYKQNAASNRDALFGPSPTSSKSKAKSSTYTSSNSAYRKSSVSNQAATMSTSTSSASRSASRSVAANNTNMTNTSTSRFKSSRSGTTVRTLSGAVKMQKMKEAEELRAKAKQAMTRGIFTRPDPVIAGTYYKRVSIQSLVF